MPVAPAGIETVTLTTASAIPGLDTGPEVVPLQPGSAARLRAKSADTDRLERIINEVSSGLVRGV
jgi:hypothetical protein